MTDHLPSAGPVGDLPDCDLIESACEVMHVAYERAAIGAGWETNPLSRTINWAEVPEANKATMRAAVAAVLPLIRAHIAEEPRRAALREAADEILREARWQKEQTMRARFPEGETSIDRLLRIWHILDERITAARVARGGTDA